MRADQPAMTLPDLNEADFRTQLLNSSNCIRTAREQIEHIQSELKAQFLETLDSDALVPRRSELMDRVLRSLWVTRGLPDTGLSLIAVGGYGRGELQPFSDIDVLILAREEHHINQYSEDLQSFITLLWDLKLDVGHSVRTLSECVAEAGGDLTIITNLLEARTLAGDPELYDQLSDKICPRSIWPSETFLNAKWQELNDRHDKHNSADYNLEPNVKNSPGALRDIQTVGWVALRHFGQGTLEGLISLGIITDSEYKLLSEAHSFLWQVRSALHTLAGREEDRLLFDLQKQVARLLGYQDDDGRSGVEHFMYDFYRQQLTVTELCELILQHIHEAHLECGPVEEEAINEHFVFSNGYLRLTTPDLFQKEPVWLLKSFLLMAQHPDAMGMHSSTIRAIRDHRHLIDDHFRHQKQNTDTFMALLRNRTRVVTELHRMMRYGVLGVYAPEFGAIIGMMEHDLLHKYTVDDHSMRMMRLMRQFRNGSIRQKFPLASRLIHNVRKKALLYLTALMHDTGKSLEGDHTLNSGELARAFCQRHDLCDEETELVSWLCENHLLMSDACQRIQIANPDDVFQFAREVGDLQRLDMLFLVSVADTHSTNPDLWTPWRAEQMRDLYEATRDMLSRGLDNRMSKTDVIAEIQREALQQLSHYGIPETRVRDIWGEPGEDYFLREGVDNVVWHILEIDAHGDTRHPLISIRQTSDQNQEGATQIFIFAPDHPNQFAVITATLDSLNLNILDARIMTSELERNAIDTFIVLDENNQAISDPDQIRHIRLTLAEALSDPEHYPTLIQRRTPRAYKQFVIPTEVTLSNDADGLCTIMEVTTSDRPGLLARVGEVLSEFGTQILNARILTEGERVYDIFSIANREGGPYSDPELCDTIRQAIIKGLDEQVEQQTNV